MTVDDDAARFAVIDALRVRPVLGRIGNKRTVAGAKRFVRPAGTGFTVVAACGCDHKVAKPGGVCPVCGGAELTDEERKR